MLLISKSVSADTEARLSVISNDVCPDASLGSITISLYSLVTSLRAVFRGPHVLFLHQPPLLPTSILPRVLMRCNKLAGSCRVAACCCQDLTRHNRPAML
mmetsp:Transcript_107653/g.278741  ORF Transcript_107653/g.278741 Transcript_107653/m.278741 type:complete len:100 (-) Transcript_107653:265-564(-)